MKILGLDSLVEGGFCVIPPHGHLQHNFGRTCNQLTEIPDRCPEHSR